MFFYGVKEWVDIVPSEIYDHALETGMFEYKNGDMQMQTDIDLNNYKIKNIPQPTNPTDLLMKQSVEIFIAYLYGVVTQSGVLTSQGTSIRFENAHITSIILFGGEKYIGTHDRLTISHKIGSFPASRYYPFRYSSRNGYIEIIINHHFPGLISIIRIRTAIQIPCIVVYRTLQI